MDKIKEMVEFCKSAERETLEKGDEVMMKIIAFDQENKSYIFALAGWQPSNAKDRDTMLQAIGHKMHDITNDLKTLVMVSDTFYSKIPIDDPSPIEAIIMNDLNTGKRRLEHLPPELHKYRGEALMVCVSEAKGRKLSMTFIPHSLVDGKIVFEKESTQFDGLEDNMLRNVWKGYLR